MVHSEIENSYIFDNESLKRLLSCGGYELIDPVDITDYYISKDTRIRAQTKSEHTLYFLQHKIGEKASGVRDEESIEISVEVVRLLSQQAGLIVKKRRYRLRAHSYLWVTITVDFIESPLKIVVAECEVNNRNQVLPPLHQILGYRFPLISCPLSAWDYFHRRIGICGAPSSGKSEVSRLFTTVINTVFDGNAFPTQEYATTFIQKYDRCPSFVEQFLVYEGQKTRELDALRRSNIVISDCPTFLSYLYAVLYKKESLNPVNSLMLGKLYKGVLLDIQNYTDIVFLRFKKYRENGIRFNDEVAAKLIDNQIEVFLQNHNIFYIESYCEDWQCALERLLYLNAIAETKSNSKGE